MRVAYCVTLLSKLLLKFLQVTKTQGFWARDEREREREREREGGRADGVLLCYAMRGIGVGCASWAFVPTSTN